MVEVASIVIAVVSFVGSLAAVVFSAYATYFTDKRKRRREARRLVAKYNDALLLACQDFQSRLYNILEWNIAQFLHEDGRKKDNLLIYTAFVVGQYLSWTYILRLQGQFLKLDTDMLKFEMRLTQALAGIVYMFSTDSFTSDDAEPFNMWRGDQMAIGEVMTIKDGGEMFPMGYAAFYEKWTENGSVIDLTAFANSTNSGANANAGANADGGANANNGANTNGGANADGGASANNGASPNGAANANGGANTNGGANVDGGANANGGANAEGRANANGGANTKDREFRWRFHSIIEGVIKIGRKKKEKKDDDSIVVPDQRLRCLQHRLVDLITILDPENLRSDLLFTSRCHRADTCECMRCTETQGKCFCKGCKEKQTNVANGLDA